MKKLFSFLWQLTKISSKIGAGIVALLGAMWLLSYLIDTYNYHYGFSRSGWRNATGSRDTMIKDLMTHHLTLGMSRLAVIEVLGPAEKEGVEMRIPDDVSLPDSLQGEKGLANMNGYNKWFLLNSQPDTLMRYSVGWAMIDPTYLHLKLGGNGKVVQYWVGIH